MVKRLADYSRSKELGKVREGFPDPETGEILNPAMFLQLHAHFPDPWPHFRQELKARLGVDDEGQVLSGDDSRLRDELRTELDAFATYPPDALAGARPLFVSRAPQRRNGGAAHMDTIYAKPRLAHKLMIEDKTTQSRRTATPKELETMAIERVAYGAWKPGIDGVEA